MESHGTVNDLVSPARSDLPKALEVIERLSVYVRGEADSLCAEGWFNAEKRARETCESTFSERRDWCWPCHARALLAECDAIVEKTR